MTIGPTRDRPHAAIVVLSPARPREKECDMLTPSVIMTHGHGHGHDAERDLCNVLSGDGR